MKETKAGFSLVEVSLAILVVAMGVMTVFALFPQALDAGRRSAEAGEIAAFAAHVFAALEKDAAFEYPGSNTNVWEFGTNVWEFGVGFGSRLDRCHAIDLGDQDSNHLDQISNLIDTNGVGGPGVFRWRPHWYGSRDDDKFGKFWAVSNYNVATFTYVLDIGNAEVNGDPLRQTKYARLEVWAGDRSNEVKAAASGARFRRGAVFYREFIAPL